MDAINCIWQGCVLSIFRCYSERAYLIYRNWADVLSGILVVKDEEVLRYLGTGSNVHCVLNECLHSVCWR